MSTANIFKPDGKNAIHDGIEHEPGGGKALLDPTDTVMLLLDHQSGLFQNVKDISVAELRANTTALAKLAALTGIPVITTASVPDGPNGPLMQEIQQAAPHAVYVPRKGEVNAWDNARAPHPGWRDSYECQCRHLRSASHLESSRCRPARRALYDGIPELPSRDGELPEGAGGCHREGKGNGVTNPARPVTREPNLQKS
jgi:hypothetical protein